jgi:predicted AlkP superfamily phosphohydrolase/phosphomutase
MKNPVIAIGLDAGDPNLIEKWMEQGHLKNLKALRDRGAYGRLKTFEYYRAETPWTTFLTGCSPDKTGYWAPVKMKEGTYKVEAIEAYDFAEYQPFYALGDDYRVAVFDMPQAPLSDGVNGVQGLAWGAHSPQTPTHSKPETFLAEIIAKHGEHPTLHKDFASILDIPALQKLQEKLEVGINRRSQICKDLLQRENWDFFLTIFGETHSAGHYFWHLSQPDHPLYSVVGNRYPGDPMLEIFEAIDRAISEIISAAPENANVVVFAAHGMDFNNMDLPSMVFLPEFLYRWSFPGKTGFANGKMDKTPRGPLVGPRAKRGFMGTYWGLRSDDHPLRGFLRRNLPSKIFNRIQPLFGSVSDPDLISPYQMNEKGDPLSFQTPCWYQPAWPRMKAFALPSFSEGYIRINLKGREPQGIVDPSEYDAVCDEITEQLHKLKDSRTGEPMVQKVVRTRSNATDSDPRRPDADLVVIWQDKCASDTVESPEIGRIGPVPFNRTGSHRSDGFLTLAGPNIEPGSVLPSGHSLDLAPTLLALLEAPIPDYFEGKPLVNQPEPAGVS